jgi:hypothetical protein
MQGRLRFGDMNIDGFPDIFTTIKIKSKKSGKVSAFSLILINIECVHSDCITSQSKTDPNAIKAKQLSHSSSKPPVRRYFNLTDNSIE